MQELFGTPWEAVDADAVRRFLAEAGDEGLLWEAKGTALPRRDAVRKAVCGFANSLGGYLILGAVREDEHWRLTGLEFPSPEPATWVGSLLEGGLSPAPECDAKAFDLGNGRAALVIRVAPVAIPPCLTASGVVYRRVSGQTLPVTDQRVLADLISAGRAAREGTAEAALMGARRLLGEAQGFDSPASLFAMALCPSAGPADRASALFERTRAESFARLAAAELVPDRIAGLYGGRRDLAMWQDCLRAWVLDESEELGATAAAFWDGTVAVAVCDAATTYSAAELVRDVLTFWPALGRGVELFGGRGETHVALVGNVEHPALNARTQGGRAWRWPLRRWTMAPVPSEHERRVLARELERAFGRVHFEPAPESL